MGAAAIKTTMEAKLVKDLGADLMVEEEEEAAEAVVATLPRVATFPAMGSSSKATRASRAHS